MDRWEKPPPPPPPPPRHRRSSPSFSSSLLEAIYRSIDESDGGNLTTGAPAASARKIRAVSERPLTRLHYASTASDSSSYFSSSSSSSDADSARIARPTPVRTGPILTRSDRIRSDPPPLPNPKKNAVSIKKKLRDLNKSTSPSSPGAKLARFLNSLFTASNHKNPKISVPPPAEDPSPSPSICSSASSYSRSCLSKTPSTRGSAGGRRSARSVRFCPVGVIVGEDCRPCGEKLLFDGELAAAAAAAERRKRMVEELLKGFEMEEEEEEESGDESEDLFELENLAGIGGGRFRDELPVYETTDLGMNCAIAKGLLV